MRKAPSVGDKAPDLVLPDLDGQVISFSDLRERPVLVSFLRHAGWLICRAHLVKVLRQQHRIAAIGAAAIFVVHDELELVRRTMVSGLDVPFPVLVDRERVAYGAWGLRRASALRIWADPRVWLRYVRVALSGERPTRFGRDTLQLGGDFIAGRDGAIAYARPQRTDDRTAGRRASPRARTCVGCGHVAPPRGSPPSAVFA